MLNKIIDAPITSQKAQRLYDFLSPFYDYLTRYERLSKAKGLAVAEIRRGHIVLEVGFGTGQTLIASALKVGNEGQVYGIDLSPRMLEKTRKRVKKLALTKRVDLQLGDARQLPYKENVFDVLFNSYMLDLIDTPELTTVLTEFERVLKPGGRLVLVNLSKGENWYSNMKLYEWIYSKCPSLLGGCRPVLTKAFLEELGFQKVKREIIFAGHIIPSEIVWGNKPK
ncbi:MAG: class I SAM-dependent methyltransferase [Candidatus Bathyarchaeota archaeon]|nr:MAG: class I SAM-dependent methyltransferase [Candidatus Bathyarchaeota archaeon]